MNKRLTQNEQRTAFYGKWEAYAHQADLFTKELTDGLFDTLRRAVCDWMTADASALCKLDDRDEYVFGCVADLMGIYRDTVALYESHKQAVGVFTVKSILEGLCAVLLSRLKQFEDTAGPDGENPVAREKQALFDKACAYTARNIEGQQALFIEQRLNSENGLLSAVRRILLQSGADGIDSTGGTDSLGGTGTASGTSFQGAEVNTSSVDNASITIGVNGKGCTGIADNVVGASAAVSEDSTVNTGGNGDISSISSVIPGSTANGTATANGAGMLSGYPHAAWTLCDEARDFCSRGLHAYYREGLRFCLTGLNDLYQRKTFRYYLELMEREQEVLSDIIKVQAAALEFAVERHQTTANEKILVQRILTMLREGHQRFGRAVTEIHAFFDEAEHSTSQTDEPVRTLEAFTQQLNAVFDDYAQSAGSVPPALAEHRAAFHAALDAETDALFKQTALVFNKAAYRFQRIISEELALANEMVAVFQKLRDRWPDAQNLPPEAKQESEIMAGIAETIEIKIESLKESVPSFGERGTAIAREYASGKREPSQEDYTQARTALLMLWMNETPLPGANIHVFFNHCLSLEPLAASKQYYEKREGEYAAKIDKALLSFKRETLLYEVSTYEEIIIYSAPRLRESAQESAAQAVALLDDALDALETLLKKNNIKVIKPAPHDMFNGREHEVLMAEQQEGFRKGEIIKPLCSGYKQKETVILRANVIAAK